MYAYYKAMPSQNLLITEMIYKRRIKKHKEKLASTKCRVDNKPPVHWRKGPKHNLKKEQMAEERDASIKRENGLLLEKVANIIRQSHDLSPVHAALLQKRAQMPKSLNIIERQREVKRITKENAVILKRLQHSDPTYSAIAWELERQQQEQILNNIVIHKGSKAAAGKKKVKRIIIKKMLLSSSSTNSLQTIVHPSTTPVNPHSSLSNT